MRKTLTSIAALTLAIGLPAGAFAQDEEVREQFEAAGFDMATIVPNAQIAQVEGEDGETYFIVGGLQTMGTMDTGMGGTAAVDPATTDSTLDTDLDTNTAAADPMVDTTDTGVTGTATATPGTGMMGFEEQLDMAGIEDYEILDDLRIGQVMAGGETLYVVHGLTRAD